MFFLFGTIWFWIILALIVIGEIIAVHHKSSTWCFGLTVVAIAFIVKAFQLDWSSLWTLNLLMYIGIFMVGGLVWIFPWTYLRCLSIRDIIRDVMEENKWTKDTPHLETAIRNKVAGRSRVWTNYPYDHYPFTIGRDMKEEIVLNMTLWPISIADTIIGEVFCRWYERAYRWCSTRLEVMRKKVFSEFEQNEVDS